MVTVLVAASWPRVCSQQATATAGGLVRSRRQHDVPLHWHRCAVQAAVAAGVMERMGADDARVHRSVVEFAHAVGTGASPSSRRSVIFANPDVVEVDEFALRVVLFARLTHTPLPCARGCRTAPQKLLKICETHGGMYTKWGQVSRCGRVRVLVAVPKSGLVVTARVPRTAHARWG